MVLVAVVVLSALAVPLFGGRLGALAEVRLRRVWAIFAALGLAVMATGLPGLPDGVRSLLLVAAYPVGAVFLAANWRVPGIPLAALGAALNLLVITANGGIMPAPQGGHPAWNLYFAVEDADAAVAKATSLGASTIMGATDVPNGTRFAILSDPSGAVFSVAAGEMDD